MNLKEAFERLQKVTPKRYPVNLEVNMWRHRSGVNEIKYRAWSDDINVGHPALDDLIKVYEAENIKRRMIDDVKDAARVYAEELKKLKEV